MERTFSYDLSEVLAKCYQILSALLVVACLLLTARNKLSTYFLPFMFLGSLHCLAEIMTRCQEYGRGRKILKLLLRQLDLR